MSPMAGSDSPRMTSTAIWLGLFFVAALLLRIVFSVGTGFDDGAQRQIFTGNDPYYHDRSLRHLLDTGENLNFDPAINYPEGRSNPNPPLFIWTTAPLAVALEASGADDPTGTALNIMTGVWGALILFPVYILARDLFGRTAALWAAFFSAVSVLIDSTPGRKYATPKHFHHRGTSGSVPHGGPPQGPPVLRAGRSRSERLRGAHPRAQLPEGKRDCFRGRSG